MTETITIAGLSNFDLLINHCECGELNLLGFHQQVKWKNEGGFVSTTNACGRCGKERTHRFPIRGGNECLEYCI